MSKLALYSAIAGAGSAGAVVVAVATGVIDLSKPDVEPSEPPVAQAAPQVAAAAPKAAPAPPAGAEASLIAEPAQPAVREEAPQEAPVADLAEEGAVVAAPKEPEPQAEVAEATAEATQDEPVAKAVAEEITDAGGEDAVDVAALPEAEAEPPQEPAQETAVKEETEVAEADPVPAPEADAGPAPTFDIVRTETDGSTLIAGAAEPNSQVDVLVDGQAEVTVTAGNDGRFVTFLDLPTAGAASVLSLRNETAKGPSLSEQEVIITPAIPVAPTEVPEKETELVLADHGSSAEPDITQENVPDSEAPTADVEADEPSTEIKEPAPQIAAVDPQAPEPPAAEPELTPEVAAQAEEGVASRDEPAVAQEPAKLMPPTILLSSARGVEVLQTAPLSPGEVALDSISYDDQGEVLLAGRGEQTASVRVYLDNAPITTSRIREDGRWRVELPEVDTGTYTLRVDQIDTSGAVISRVESPFLRESAEVLTQAATSGNGVARSITVQPGHTLWEISSNRYGDGKDYVRVFDANRDRIGDPDLIYPGQIFDLPD